MVHHRADAPFAPPVSGNVEERLEYLESAVAGMRRTMSKERSLLRKAILIQLDMDDVYSEPQDGDGA